jgi:prophage antirepressor-like protein
MKKAKKRNRAIQRDLFGHPIEETRPRDGEVIPLDWETHAVRMTMIRGAPWWIAADVCRILDIANPRDAVSRLDEDEKGVASTDTLGGRQNLAVINESGLYCLIFTSRKPEAKRFKRWVTHEVLPEIRRTGSYFRKPTRIAKEQKRLGCDADTAKVRCDQFAANKELHARMASEKAKPNHFRAVHNGVYRGQSGKDAPQIREALDLSRRATPLDHMALIPLAINMTAKAVAERIIRDLGIPIDDQAETYERVAADIAKQTIERLGAGYEHRIVDDPRRGKILDVVRPAMSLN